MDMKRDYYEDIRLLNTAGGWFWFIVLTATLCVLPLLLPGRTIYLLNNLGIFVIVAVGLNLLVGYTGQISLGHAGFFAIGAYFCFAIMKIFHVPFLIALPASGLIAGGLGYLLGLVALRLEGPYLAIATIGFAEAIVLIIKGIPYFGGGAGMDGPPLSFLGDLIPLRIDAWLNTLTGKYYLIAALAVLFTWGARNLVKTRVGRAFIAIRDSDTAAQTMGVSLTKFKTLAFSVSAFYAGVAGGLFGLNLGRVTPGEFDIILSITFLAMVVVGGTGAILGGVMGALLLGFLEFELKGVGNMPVLGPVMHWLTDVLNMSETGLPEVRYIIYGLIMIGIIVFEPLGLYGIWIRSKRYWRTWPF